MEDSITRSVVISAPLERVWNAVTDYEQFSAWFRFTLEAPFRAGEITKGHLDHSAFGLVNFRIFVVAIEPMHRFTFEWHPYSVDSRIDYTVEPKTHIEFDFVPESGGIRVTMTESGFDGIPAYRREEAFRMNREGWTAHMESLHLYVSGNMRPAGPPA